MRTEYKFVKSFKVKHIKMKISFYNGEGVKIVETKFLKNALLNSKKIGGHGYLQAMNAQNIF